MNFIRFSSDTKHIDLPNQFTFPFNYTPHELCLKASAELQALIESKDWEHDFSTGKMFGVLIVRNEFKELGYLVAFSGKLGDKSIVPPFVPPVYDRLTTDGFFIDEENELTEINIQVRTLEEDPLYTQIKEELKQTTAESETTLAEKRKAIKASKKERDAKRKEAASQLTPEAFETLQKALIKESQDHQFQYKRLAKAYREKIEKLTHEVSEKEKEINALKMLRKTKSGALQQKLFNQYQFLNANNEAIGLFDIFKNTPAQIPPAGAGDCAAPKLLHYAYQNNLEPICMAEFWWGASPNKEVRIQGHFYPACKSKCEPILGHMLQGLDVDPNPLDEQDSSRLAIETIFEDEHLAVIHKPSGLLSIPGKKKNDSVATRMKIKYPDATGPLVVHRLDMSTSGLMLIAKSLEVHKELQQQFVKHTISKRYIAVLDGEIEEEKGTVDLPLRVDLDNRPSQVVCYEHGKAARTHWERIKIVEGKTWIHFYPVTGRTHQLRVHSAHSSGLNTPIIGDDIYGTSSNRLHLHAEKLDFIHPISNKALTFLSEAPF